MKRRDFIKGTAASLTLPFWLQGCTYPLSESYTIDVQSDYNAGHLMMKSSEWRKVTAEKTQTIIVGGGIAGVTAAQELGHTNFKLFELSNRLGGSSGAQQHNGITFSQGAHYELAYPEYYGEEVLALFEKQNIIQYEPWKKMWSFVDRQHIIPFARRQQCFENGKIRNEVIEDGLEKRQFYELLDPYQGEMPLPTRLIPEAYRHLNDITFIDFLSDKMDVSPSFKRQIDYHMLDDWGGTSDQISAVAGIHYFMCRPYLTQSVDLFSPPEGNYYFLNKISSELRKENLLKNHLVSKIEKKGDGFVVEVIDVAQELVKVYEVEQLIYAGQKHALKYVYPKESGLFEQTQTPWMVLNFVCKGTPNKYGFWQNEFLGENPAFMGFIDSSVQDPTLLNGKRIITAYYCLKPEDREYLSTIPEHKEEIAEETLSYITEMLDEKLNVESCHIHVMGHAMSVPTPGFLFNDANDKSTDLIYAGVDNGRLPLLYEAVDSGLMAGGS